MNGFDKWDPIILVRYVLILDELTNGWQIKSKPPSLPTTLYLLYEGRREGRKQDEWGAIFHSLMCDRGEHFLATFARASYCKNGICRLSCHYLQVRWKIWKQRWPVIFCNDPLLCLGMLEWKRSFAIIAGACKLFIIADLAPLPLSRAYVQFPDMDIRQTALSQIPELTEVRAYGTLPRKWGINGRAVTRDSWNRRTRNLRHLVH